MDDHNMIISLILRGCKMAKDLESRLESKTNLQPQVVAESCDEIVRVFIEVRERLNVSGHGQNFNPLQMYSSREGVDSRIFQEYFTKFSPARMMGDPGRSSSSSGMLMEGSSSMAGGSGELVMELGSGDMHAIGGAALDSAVMGPSSHRKPRRKEDGDRRTVMAPAPQTGNTEIPPDDGFTWRKYGQKEILGSKYPRGYYRCTHQKLYNCPAKKQVQRMDDNPSIYEVTYRGEHTCHKSATAPSVAPPPPPEITPQHRTHSLTAPATTHSRPLGQWLEFSLGGRDSGAGPSTTINRNVDQFPVVDMADVMFNSGSSSSNSMEFIFSSGMEDRWESGDKKN